MLRANLLPCVVAIALPACVVAQTRTAPRRGTIGEVAERVGGSTKVSVRRIDGGSARPLSLDDDTPLQADLLLLSPGKEHEVKSGTKSLKTLPFKIQLVDHKTMEVTEYWPVIEPVREVLEFDGASKAYQAEVLVGLIDKGGIGTRVQLPQSLILQLVTSLGRVAPGTVPIDHVGTPFTAVVLTVVEEVADVRLRVLWGSEPGDAVERTFALLRSKITVDANPSRIAGFGLGVTDIVVHAPGAGQRGIKSALVSYDRGRLEGTQQIALDAEGIGVAHLRSTGVGEARVRVSVTSFEPGEVDVVFHWPIAFILFAVAGGLIGGVTRHLRGRRTKKQLRMEVVRSTLIGLVVAVAYAVGINLLGIQLGTGIGEGFVLVVAFLGASRGIKVPGSPVPSVEPTA